MGYISRDEVCELPCLSTGTDISAEGVGGVRLKKLAMAYLLEFLKRLPLPGHDSSGVAEASHGRLESRQRGLV